MTLPEQFSVGLLCPVVDLAPLLPIAIFLAAFVWQASVGFR